MNVPAVPMAGTTVELKSAWNVRCSIAGIVGAGVGSGLGRIDPTRSQAANGTKLTRTRRRNFPTVLIQKRIMQSFALLISEFFAYREES